MKFPNSYNIVKTIKGSIKKTIKAIITLPIFIKFVAILITTVTVTSLLAKVWEVITGENTPQKVYEDFDVEDMSEIIQIKEYNGGYYLDFADDVDEKLDSLVESLETSGKYHYVPKELLKKMIKAEVVTEFPDLGGEIPEDSDGFQGAIDIKRVTPNKEVGEMKNTGQSESSILEKETEEEKQLTELEKEIKTWEKGKELKIYSDAIVYEQVSSDIQLPNSEQKETGYWQEKIQEGTLNQYVTIKQNADIQYNGNYRVSTSPLTGVTIIYIEVKAKQGNEEIVGYIKSGKVITDVKSDNSEDEEQQNEEKKVSSRATNVIKRDKEIVGNEGDQFKVAIAAGHSTVNPGATANGLVEQELTIQVAEKVQELIEQQYENVTVVQTGTTSQNKDLSNANRVSLAKAEDPDLCIQIHFNASGSTANSATGVETIYKPGDGISGQLADILSRTISQSMGLENRGSGTDLEKSQRSLGIIASYAETGFPSVVTEGGFLDNTNDANIIKNGGIEKYAQGIVNGIKEYLEADHSGYTTSKEDDQTVTESVESRIFNMKYVKLEDLKAMEGDGKSSNDVKEATKYFSLDENNKLITLTWNRSEDGNISISENSPVDLKSQLQKYTMPFEYLLMFYIDSDYEDFVSELADVVLDSEIVVALQDEVSTTETTVNTYEKRSSNSPLGQNKNYQDKLIESERKYTISESCATNIDITYIDVWFIKTYKTNSYSEKVLNMGDQEEIIAKAPGKVTETPSTTLTEYAEYSTGLKDYVTISNGKDGVSEVKEYTYNLYRKTKTDIRNIKNTYDEGDIEFEKKEDSFVDLYVKHSMNDRVRETWLLEILEKNEKTANWVDLTKYLMYKATKVNYGITDFDFSEYELSSFTSIDGNFGDWDGTGSQEDFIKAVAPYAVIDMEQHQIYASVTIAQAIIESGWGKDNIAIQYKNFFGMKAFSSSTPNEFWSGEKVNLNASEGGTSYFKVYDSLKNSVYDHGRNFHVTPTYASHGVLDCMSQNLGPKEQLRRIALSGYAVDNGSITRPDGVRTYDQYLYEEFIQKYDLEKYDKMTSADFQDTSSNSDVIEIAKSQLGVSYVWGGASPSTGFDCSGFVQWVYKQVGVSLPRTTSDYRSWLGTSKQISWSEAQPGDLLLVYYSDGGHIGIYLGNNEYIHAPEPGDVVKISPNAQSAFQYVLRVDR